jgi:DNA polymerase-3 subunit delta'
MCGLPITFYFKIMKSFSQIIGQEKAIRFLKKAIARGKIPHAFLFTGIQGIGKTTTAIAFTQAINCLEPMEGEGCGRCIMCRRLISGNFPDLIIIEPDGQNIKIEQIRELNRRLNYRPVAGSYRVTIIKQAEEMNEEAANSFLKTLEEPPLGNILILETIEARDLLSTIVSRCQKIPFQPISFHLISEWLKTEMGMDGEKALLISRLSEGSLGRAINIAKATFLEERQDYLSKIMQLPTISKEQAMGTALEYAGRFKKRDKENDESVSTEMSELIGLWKTWYRDLILMKVDGPAELLINSDFSRKLKAISARLNIDNLIESFVILDQAQRDLDRNLNIGLIMENTYMNLKRLSG